MNTPKLLISLFVLTGACAHSPSAGDGRKTARATLESRSGSTVTGDATWVEAGGLVTVTIALSGASPGEHAVHIHEIPDCTDPEAMSAGDHWNPTHENHGQFEHPPYHLGDIGNIEVNPNGSGSFTFATPQWSIGTGANNDVLQHSIVVHASVDDMKTNPSGNSGGRVACGVITLK
jgi:Cu-Zn family superoxide dismutase